MNEYIKIAWRNLWRNRSRTGITAASILLAVFLAITMRAFQLGTYDNMIKNAVESYSGFIQVQNVEYKDDASINNTFSCPDEMLSGIRGIEGVKAVVPRIESFALASTGTQSKGVMVLGIDPAKEAQLSDPKDRLVRYRFTSQVIKKLKSGNQISEMVKHGLDNLTGKSYPKEQGFISDLNLEEEPSQGEVKLLSEAAAFSGEMLKQGDDGVLMSDRLAKFFKINIGDTLILLGQGYHGATAAQLFPVRGIVKIPSPELDNKLVYMTLPSARYFFSLEDQVSSVAINLHDNDDDNLTIMKDKIAGHLSDESLLVRDWKEFNKVLHQQIEGDNESGKVIIALLYFIIFFGIFGTILMMIFERYREFGVLVSVGMQKYKLAGVVFIEMIMMSILGVVLGILISLPILYVGHHYPLKLTGDMALMMENYGLEPIMPLAWLGDYIYNQAIIVCVMVAIACIYPLIKIFNLKEVQALRA